ncbi:MAG: hypothetical protein QNJ98_15245 [Planctomycetota bacterium]|nr:hypothetical protein [Planctomycetota bacterium]
MHVRAVITAVACLAMVACASTKSSQRASKVTSKRVYKQSATVRTSTPQARRLPSWPAQSYRAPSVRTYAATPTTSTRRASTPAVRSYRYGTVPPPPPPPSLHAYAAPRTAGTITPARAPATTSTRIRPASRPARTAASMAIPQPTTAPVAKPIAPLSSGRLFRDSGSYSKSKSTPAWWKAKASPGRGCKT